MCTDTIQPAYRGEGLRVKPICLHGEQNQSFWKILWQNMIITTTSSRRTAGREYEARDYIPSARRGTFYCSWTVQHQCWCSTSTVDALSIIILDQICPVNLHFARKPFKVCWFIFGLVFLHCRSLKRKIGPTI